MNLLWPHKSRGSLAITPLTRWMGLTSCGQHNRTFPASSLFQPRCTAQPGFHAFQQKTYQRLTGWQRFRLSLNQCPSGVDSKSFAHNKGVCWQINTDGEPGVCLVTFRRLRTRLCTPANPGGGDIGWVSHHNLAFFPWWTQDPAVGVRSVAVLALLFALGWF